MPKASAIRSSFNAGELSPLLDGRVDVSKYGNGCRILENFIPTVQGPATRRPGTRFVAETKSATNRTWLARFEFSSSQAYILEFGDQYIRFYTNHGQLQTGAVSAYSAGTFYTPGDVASQGGVNYICIANSIGNAPPNATYWYALTGTIYEVPTPYPSYDLADFTDGTFRLSLAQTGDVLYIAHPGYALRKLSRFSATKWSLQQVELLNGPFKTQNSDRTVTIYSSAATSSVTLTASSAIFTPAMVGSYVYLEPADLSTVKPWTAGEEWTTNPVLAQRRSDGKTYSCTTSGVPTAGKAWRSGPDKPIHTYGTAADGGGGAKIGTNIEREGLDWQFLDSGFGYVKITAYTSATSVQAIVQGTSPLPGGVVGSGNATFRWALSAFSGQEGYPSRVTFFRERLTLAKDQTLYFSVSADFENFAARDESGQIVADRAIQATISSDQVNAVQWMSPSQKLLIGTTASEFSCSENSSSEPFSPGNLKIEQETSEGSRSVTPLRIGNAVLMVQRSGRKLKELQFAIQQYSYQSNDLNILAEHITQGGIQQVTWHKEPYLAVWAVRGDGQLLGFTYNKEQDTVGWHRHILGGAFGAGAPVVESVCVIGAPDRTRDELWMTVKRTINGQTKRYIEYLEREWQVGDTQASCYYVDCGATYSGAPATTISGLSWLEGQTVQVLTDGAAHPDRTVTGGAITLQVAASTVQVGLGYNSTLQTNRIEAGAGDGTAQGKTKRLNKVVIRFLNTLGAKAGPNASTLDTIEFRDGSNPMDAPPPLFTGDKLIEWPGSYEFEGYCMVRQTQPLPMTVVAIMPQLHTFDRT